MSSESPSVAEAASGLATDSHLADVPAVKELIRRVNITYRCRFNAHRRMSLIHRANQWTIPLLSVALMVVPLAQGFGLTLAVRQATVNVIQVLLAVGVLVFSLRIDASNFQLRAEKHLQCGKALTALLMELQPFQDGGISSGEYAGFARTYQAILDGYENHEPVDYQFMRLLSDDHDTGIWDRFSAYIAFCASFVVPVVPMVGVLVWLSVAFSGARF